MNPVKNFSSVKLPESLVQQARGTAAGYAADHAHIRFTSVKQSRQTGETGFYLLAGPNGAGKSTLYKALALQGTIPASAEFVNAHLHEAAQLQHIADLEARSETARHWADARHPELLRTGQSFVSETVFPHESKLALIKEAQQLGWACGNNLRRSCYLEFWPVRPYFLNSLL